MRKNMLIPFALMVLPTFSLAQSYDDLVQVEILPGWRTGDGAHIAAIQLTLAPGWITYWRAPGDAGIPTQFGFAGNVTPHWPTPEIIDNKGVRSVGYSNSIVFPITVEADASGKMAVQGELFIGICEEICIPVTLDIDALLPTVGSADPVISAALAAQPLSQADANVGSVICTIAPISDGLQVTTLIDVTQSTTDEFVVVEAPDPRIWVSQADVTRDGATLRATVDMVHVSGAPFALDRSGIRMTVLGGDQAIDIQGCAAG